MTKPRIVSRTLPARVDLMQNPLALGLWLGLALYAAIGLFGVIIFHDAAPFMPDTTGYGITVSGAAVAPEAGR
jgi:hypothetical protein